MAAKMKKKTKYFVSVLAAVFIMLTVFFVFTLIKGAINEVDKTLDGPYEVLYVIDGDTIVVSKEGNETHVRFIGVDTPESVASEDYEENTKEGELASEYTKNLLSGNTVFLEYDSEIYDKYGRTLCYVYLSDGVTMVNELLLKNGYAKTMTIEPNVKYEERFLLLENEARVKGEGVWGTGFFK